MVQREIPDERSNVEPIEGAGTSRRRVLGSIGAVATAGVAGCTDLRQVIDAAGGGGSQQSISYGETIESSIDSGDGQDPEYNDLAEPVEFEASAGDVFKATMVSGAFDAYLLVTGPEGTTLAEDDDGAGGTDSSLTLTAPQQGTYTIWAGSLSGDATGSYTLTLSKRGQEEVTTPASGERSDLRSIAYGETKGGYVDRSDGRDPEYDDVAEPVTFDGRRGDRVTITMSSDAFDAFVVLTGPDGGTITEADDGATGTDSLLQTTLPEDGTYTIWAGSLSGDATGSYTLTLEKTGEGSTGGGDLRSISYGETREGYVDTSDGRDPEYNDVAEPVAFDGSEGDFVSITMSSDAFDPYLVLTGPNGDTVAEADDGAGGYDSLVETSLSVSGTFTIWAGSLDGGATGSYTLTLEQG